ncbi:MAG: TIGR03086 family protein [Actinobacteria bacterium]|nr:TIGR03086 family protein [Actinomycetota bacterium]
MQSKSSALLDRYRRTLSEFDARVRQVGDDQWGLPTPCTDWNVRQLVNHLVYEDRWTAPLMRGSTLEEVGDRFDGDLLGDRPKDAWSEASREALDSVEEEGALDRSVNLSSGPTPASEYVDQLASDHLIHAWDLARAIGADERLDPELVDWLYEQAAPREDELKSYGIYGDKVEVSADSDTQTKLLAVFGRRA